MAKWGLPGTWRASPATRAGIRLRRPVRTERGATPGVSASRKLVPGRLDSWLLLNTPAASFQGRPREGRISGTAAAAPGGRGGGGGRLARRLGERPGGPGLSPPAASTTLGGWDTLRLCQTRQETFRPGRETSKQTAVRRRCPPASAFALLNPAPTKPPRLAATSADLSADGLRGFEGQTPRQV